MSSKALEALRSSPLCGEGAYLDTKTLRYEFEQVAIVVENVPAVYCPATGEHLIPGPIGVVLDELVQKAAEAARVVAEQAGATDSDGPVETQVVFPSGGGTPILA